jgi:flagellar biosynthesis protein FlhB
MKVGVLIVLIPALAFGVFDVLYVAVFNPDFMEKYYQHQLSQMQQSMTGEKFEAARAEMESEKAMFSNPAISFMVMFLSVFVIGVIITVISSLILRRNANAASLV